MEEDPVAQCGDSESAEKKDPSRFCYLKIEHSFTIEASQVVTYGRIPARWVAPD